MSARITDSNGWYTIPNNPISKAGVFPYKGSLIGASDPSKIYNVFRPPEELSNKATLDSFKLVPLINDHVMLGKDKPGYVPAEKKGVHGVLGEQIKFDENTGMMLGNIRVFSESLDEAIEFGKERIIVRI